MSNIYSINNVNPGDLIKAAYIDSLVAAILDLNKRVAKLEGQAVVAGDQVTITSVTDPQASPNGVFHVLDMITVSGTNFSVPAAANYVTVNGYQIGAFGPGSSANTLIFAIPAFPASVPVSSSGTSMLLSIQNTAGSSAVWLLNVAPQVVIPSGTLGVAYTVVAAQATGAPADNNIHGNYPYTFGFQIAAHVYEAGNYVLTATISSAGWTAAIQGGQPVTGGSQLSFQLPAASQNTAGTTQNVSVTVTPPNATSGTAILNLSVKEVTTGTQVVPATLAPPLTIAIAGTIPPVSVVQLAGTNASSTTGAIAVSTTASAATFTMNFLKAATYTINFAASAGYTILTTMPLTQVITAAMLPASGVGVSVPQNVFLEAAQGAIPGTLTATITDNAGDPTVTLSANIQAS